MFSGCMFSHSKWPTIIVYIFQYGGFLALLICRNIRLSLVAGAEGDTPRGERHVHDGCYVVSTNPTHAKQASEILRNPACGH